MSECWPIYAYLAPKMAVISPVEQYPSICLRIIGGKLFISNEVGGRGEETSTVTTLGEETDWDVEDC